MELETKSLETKAAVNGLEIKEAFDDFLRAFEAFKESNDERLAQVERKHADVVTDEKVDRINRALDEQKRAIDELSLAATRPSLGGEFKAAPDRATRERKTAFDRYVRKGDASGFDALELKSLSAGSNPDGGYVVPLEIEQTIDRILQRYSPIRAISSVRQIGGNIYRKPITTVGASTGWVAETASRTQTNSPTLSVVDFPAMELYAMPAATQVLLDDAAKTVTIVFVIDGGGSAITTGIKGDLMIPFDCTIATLLAAIRSSAKAAQASLDAAQNVVTDPAFKNGDALEKSVIAANGAVAAFAAISAQLPTKGTTP